MQSTSCDTGIKDVESSHLTATRYPLEFDWPDDTYNALCCAGNGKIYYVISSTSIDRGGQMHSFDPFTGKKKFLGDLTEICGEKGKNTIPQGKSHTRFYECNGKLYFATHVGYYQTIDGIERMPENTPAGYDLYPGGHILSYDLTSEKFEDLVTMEDGQGIITMTMDCNRGHIYAITWPKGDFVHYDSSLNKLKNLGPVSAKGEAGVAGEDYRVLCRSMFIDPKTGSVYFSTSEGDIFIYRSYSTSFRKMEDVNLRFDYFGKYDPAQPGSMGYNWRKIIWDPVAEVAYGVHGGSGYLFRFDPRNETLEIIDRITSAPSKKSGMFSQSRYGSLAFQLGPDNTLYYLTTGPVCAEGTGRSNSAIIKGVENLHLITYRTSGMKYTDHGPVFFEDGSRPGPVNSIAVAGENIFTLSWSQDNGKKVMNLLKIRNPFLSGEV